MLKNLRNGVSPGRDRPNSLRSAPLALIMFVLCSPFAMGTTKGNYILESPRSSK